MLSLRWLAWIPPRLPGFRAGVRRISAGAFSYGRLITCFTSMLCRVAFSDLTIFDDGSRQSPVRMSQSTVDAAKFAAPTQRLGMTSKPLAWESSA